MIDLSAAVARRLAARRRELGLTLEELGDMAGLHRTAVGLIEREQRRLTINSAASLCGAMGLRLSDVIRAAEDAEPEP